MRGYNIDDYINRKYNHLTLIKNLNKLDKHNSKLALFRCVGYFDTLEEAIEARQEAEKLHFRSDD